MLELREPPLTRVHTFVVLALGIFLQPPYAGASLHVHAQAYFLTSESPLSITPLNPCEIILHNVEEFGRRPNEKCSFQ